MQPRPPLSVILAARDPGPDLDLCLERLVPQLEPLGAELVIGAGYEEAHPAVQSPRVIWARIPGGSVFDLRARAAEVARGEIIALTEDHCVVAADWCRQVLNIMAASPDTQAIAGGVLNGSEAHSIDRANHLLAFGSLVPPINREQHSYVPPVANVAFRRGLLPAGPVAPGWIELELNPSLFRQGAIEFHDEITVSHMQSAGWWKTLRAHFSNGRTTTGLHPVPFSRRQLPWIQYRTRVATLGGGAPFRRSIRAALPLLFLICCAHSLGEVVGILSGPGDSARQLR